MALTVDTLTASTIYHQSAEIADEVMHSNAVLTQLSAKGRVVKVRGGTDLREPCMYDGGAIQWFSGWEQLNTAYPESVTNFVYDWKFGQTPVIISKKEELLNADSQDRMFDLLASRLDGSRANLKNGVAEAIRGDGTGSDGKTIMGLAGLFPSANTGTIGGVDRSTYTFAQHYVKSFATDLGYAWSKATIQDGLLAAWMNVARGSDEPDLWLMTQTPFKYFHGSLTPIQVTTKAESALRRAGYRTLEFMNGEAVLDAGFGESASTELIYGLNTNYLKLKVHPDLYFTRLGSVREPKDQAGTIQFIGFAGALTCSAPNFQVRLAA